MIEAAKLIPSGPCEQYDARQDLLTWMRSQFAVFGDIYKASAYGTNTYMVNRPEYAQHVLRKNWQNYKKGFAIKRIGLLLGNGLMVSEGDVWIAQRKAIRPAFHTKTVEQLACIAKTANTTLLMQWELAAGNGETINVTRDTSLMALKIVLQSIFGDDYQRVASPFNVLSEESARNLEFAQTFKPLRHVVAEVVASRRRDSDRDGSDILGLMMDAPGHDGGSAMSDSLLISEILTLVVAGHETTASTLNWAWYLISQHPDVEQRMQVEVDQLAAREVPDIGDLPNFVYVRQVVEEAMRLYPAGWLLTRRAKADDQLGEYFVPAGTEIYISPYFLQRHPALWDNPDRFDPDRFSAARSQDRPELAMLAFSAGPRNCIGELFARVEMQMHLIMVSQRLRLRYVGAAPPELDAGVNLRSKSDIMMMPENRSIGGATGAEPTMRA